MTAPLFNIWTDVILRECEQGNDAQTIKINTFINVILYAEMYMQKSLLLNLNKNCSTIRIT